MKSKSFSIIGPKEIGFARIIAGQFGVYSESEIKLIMVLIKLDMFAPFYLDKHTRKVILSKSDMPYNTMSTSLRRLCKSGIIARNGKSHFFNVAFRGLADVDCILFK